MVLMCSAACSQEANSPTKQFSSSPARELELAIESRDACQLARIHYDLGDIPAAEIVKLFYECANAGDARGTMWLARLYLNGRCGLKINETTARQMAARSVAKVLELAKGGDREAQFLAGAAYQEGLGVEVDYKEAAKWYAPAAAAGQIGALNNLGIMYIRGYGVPADIAKARALLTSAAEKGLRDAAKTLRVIQGSHRDESARLKNLFKAAVMHAIGKQKKDGIEFLAKKGLISDSKKSEDKGKVRTSRQFYFSADGLSIFVDEITGRINGIEGYAAGHMGDTQFRGRCPLGIAWSDTSDTAREKLGAPSDSGDVPGDYAYGMAYEIDNLIFAVMFSYSAPKTLRVWRVYETWVTDYGPLQDEKNITPEAGADHNVPTILQPTAGSRTKSTAHDRAGRAVHPGQHD